MSLVKTLGTLPPKPAKPEELGAKIKKSSFVVFFSYKMGLIPHSGRGAARFLI
jgi:hypothetical protein